MDNRVSTLENSRSTGKALTGSLDDLWRYRVGDYRVICKIQDGALQDRRSAFHALAASALRTCS
jgi:mRNA interferase RelE/StbE